MGSRTEDRITNGEWDQERRMDRLFKSRRFIQVSSFYSSLVVLFKSRRFIQVSSFYSSLVVLFKSRRFIQVLSFRAQRGISSPGTGRGRFLAALGMTRITYGKLTRESLLTESLLGESLLTESLLAAR